MVCTRVCDCASDVRINVEPELKKLECIRILHNVDFCCNNIKKLYLPM